MFIPLSTKNIAILFMIIVPFTMVISLNMLSNLPKVKSKQLFNVFKPL